MLHNRFPVVPHARTIELHLCQNSFTVC